jgi:tripartite-type tricarboxylate transporter receptor subunit TctC
MEALQRRGAGWVRPQWCSRRRMRHLCEPGIAIAILAALFGVVSPIARAAETWPARQIRVIVPVSPGSAIDLVARTVFDDLATRLGQPLVIEHRLGAGGAIGAASVAKAEPDGYTLLAHSVAISILPTTLRNAGYDAARDFAAVAPLANLPLVLSTQPKYKSVAALVAAGKARPASLSYASVGYGATAHLVAERFRLAAGFEAQHVPFKGSPEGLTEIMAGRIDFTFSPILTALPLAQSGKISALAVSSRQRASALPDVPTTVEAGFPNSEFDFWIGLFLPARTPRDIVEKLNAETIKSLQTPAVRDHLASLGADPMIMTATEFAAYLRQQVETNSALTRQIGIKPQ